MIHAIVHLDGVDKTGKDSIKNEIVKQSNGRVLVVARSFLSQIAYNRIYNRFIDESFFIQKMKKLQRDKDYHFIYLEANKKDLEKRFQRHNEDDLKIQDINYHIHIFENIIQELKEHKIEIKKINTSNYNIKHTVEEILKLL